MTFGSLTLCQVLSGGKQRQMTVLASGISRVPLYFLSVSLYLSCNKTLSLFYEHVDCSFPLKYQFVCIPFKYTTQTIDHSLHMRHSSTSVVHAVLHMFGHHLTTHNPIVNQRFVDIFKCDRLKANGEGITVEKELNTFLLRITPNATVKNGMSYNK